MRGFPAIPVARDTRPPAGGPTRRYLRPLNSAGPLDGFSGSSAARTAATAARAAMHNSKVTRRTGRTDIALLLLSDCGPDSIAGGLRLGDPGPCGGGPRRRRDRSGLSGGGATAALAHVFEDQRQDGE